MRHRRVRIGWQSSCEVRRRLFEAKLRAVRFNRTGCTLYRRLINQGKADEVARLALARELLLIAHAIHRRARATSRSVSPPGDCSNSQAAQANLSSRKAMTFNTASDPSAASRTAFEVVMASSF